MRQSRLLTTGRARRRQRRPTTSPATSAAGARPRRASSLTSRPGLHVRLRSGRELTEYARLIVLSYLWAVQLQKIDDASPAAVEFDRLREHYEPLLRPAAPTSAALASSAAGRTSHVSSSVAAASSALKRNVPALRTKPRSSVGRGSVELLRSSGDGDELVPYRARGDARTEAGLTTPVGLGEEDSALWLGQVEDLDGVAPLESRWASAWRQSIRARDLRPTRVHLRAKKTRRCMDCRHILIKPEKKAQSVRFKIKLLAASYLPTVEISARMPSAAASAALRRDRSARMSTTGTRSGVEIAASLAAADKDGLTRGSNVSRPPLASRRRLGR